MPDHLSYSQISLYLECSLLYKLRYVEGEKGEGTPAALVFGSAIHKALAGFYTEVMDGELFSLAAFLGAFEEAWRDAVEEREIIYKEGEDFDSLLGLGKEMLKVFSRSVMPQRQNHHPKPPKTLYLTAKCQCQKPTIWAITEIIRVWQGKSNDVRTSLRSNQFILPSKIQPSTLYSQTRSITPSPISLALQVYCSTQLPRIQ